MKNEKETKQKLNMKEDDMKNNKAWPFRKLAIENVLAAVVL